MADELGTLHPDGPTLRLERSLNRPGVRGGSLPVIEDESYEWKCDLEADAAAVLV